MTKQFLQVVRVFSLDELRAISASEARGLEAILWPSKKRYIFNPSSTADDDGDLVIKPADGVDGCCQGGRWDREYAPPTAADDLTILEAEDVAGNSGAGGADITDAKITFTLTKEKDVAIFGQATANTDFALRTSAALAVKVDGSPYDGTTASSSTLGSGQVSALALAKKVHLLAGVHTVQLIGGGSIGVISGVGNPTRLVVVF